MTTTNPDARRRAEALLEKHRWIRSEKLVQIMCEFAANVEAEAKAEAIADCVAMCYSRGEIRAAEAIEKGVPKK